MNPMIDRIHRTLLGLAIVAAGGLSGVLAAGARWNDDALVAQYHDLLAAGTLDAAILDPVLPKGAAHPAFLDALAWFAAGMPDAAGTLTEDQLDAVMGAQADSYRRMLAAKVEQAVDNDYARTRTWKVIQKLTILRGVMTDGSYRFPQITKTETDPGDTWEREHTLRSAEEFDEKVCRGSYRRPVLVKFGNTNCTQCMLFELIGSVRELAETPQYKDSVDVYKVWWGFRPDASFAGRIKDPARLNDLVKAEGVTSSPTFIAYRNGRAYPCGEAFPTADGVDEALDACVHQSFADAPLAAACTPDAVAATRWKGRPR